MSKPKRKQRFFANRFEVVTFTHFVVISSLFGALLIALGLLNRGKTQVVLLGIGVGTLSSLLPIIGDTLINRRELHQLENERHDVLLNRVDSFKAATVEEVRSIWRQSQSLTSNSRLGLECAFVDDKQPECVSAFREFLETPQTLTVMMNYSSNWIENHRAALTKRYADETRSTLFIFMDPRTRCFEVQADKQATNVKRLREKLAEAIGLLDEIAGREAEILGHQYFHVQHVLVGDTRAVVSSYFSAGEKQPSPVFFYRDTEWEDDMFKRLQKDVQRVRNSAHPIRDWYQKYATGQASVAR